MPQAFKIGNNLKQRVPLRQKIVLILFGIFLAQVILEIGLRLAGLGLYFLQEYRNVQTIKQKGVYRIMCLGESTTFCGGPDYCYCCDTEYSYPYQLNEILNQKGLGVKFNVINKGLPSIDTSYILAHLEENLKLYKPNMVITMMGINDGGDYIFFQKEHTSKAILLFRSLRTYKLAKLLLLHLTTRVKDKEPYHLQKDPQFQKQVGLSLQISQVTKIYAKYLSFDLREKAFRKRIDMNPNNDSAYFYLGWFYQGENRLSEAATLFKKTAEINPRNICAYAMLGWYYEHQGEYSKAENTFKKGIEINPESDILYAALGILYRKIGKYKLAEVFRRKSNGLRLKRYNSMTLNNYLNIKKILDNKGAKLICAQYPMRSVEPLKKIFKDDKGVIFVDNESTFNNVIEQEDYRDYFVDMFAGDFGHCTPKGNQLLAENIANVILKEVFGR